MAARTHPPNISIFLHLTIIVTLLSFCFFSGKSSHLGQTGLWNEPGRVQEEDGGAGVVLWGHQASSGCDYSDGKWIFDSSYPLYDPDCPYLSSVVACQRNGRPDANYQKWKWKPNSCSLPRFDALRFLGKMRTKRIMLVGDSIMRNQWESLVCLVQGVVPTGRKKVTYAGPSMAFHALDFETSIEFCWAPMLVELKKDPEKNLRILHLDSIEENARYWRGADVLVFDSAHWWTHSTKWIPWDYYKEGNSLFKSMDPMVVYQKGLKTWSRWIDLNLDPRRTRVIFRSMSPRHNRDFGWTCNNQKNPLQSFSRKHAPEPMVVLKEVLKRMSFPVYFQDITKMSAFRGDGHPSVYRREMGQKARRQHAGAPASDCSHWCLPGVPDIWNEILSALL